jgi:hypothetical protein
MTKISTLAVIASVLAAATLASGNAFAHGMGHMGSGMGTHTGNFSQTNTMTKSNRMTKTSDHDRHRDHWHRRFFAFGYFGPDYACVYKRTVDGLVKICPDAWY